MERDYSAELAATELGQIRERDHNKTLELAARELNFDPQPPISYRTLTQEERDTFTSSGSGDVHPMLGGRPWAREFYLLGNLTYMASRRGTALGHLSFSLLNNGDALIIQVQGIKGRNFTPDKRTKLVQTAADFAAGIGINRLFLVTGSIVNEVRENPEPRLIKVYEDIAREAGFTERLNGIPYINLRGEEAAA